VVSGISPRQSLGWAHVFTTFLPDIEVFVEATDVSPRGRRFGDGRAIRSA
jgi:hypothetical protein